MAERKGFEPLIPFGIRAFQARALGQTTLPLRIQSLVKPRECDRNFTINQPDREGKEILSDGSNIFYKKKTLDSILQIQFFLLHYPFK